jgi:formaldehyde-activating enzyme involved in methanogenesis
MKLLYEIASGNVLARYSEDLSAQLAGLSLGPSEPAPGHALITVPDSVAIPQVIVRVVHGDSGVEFIVDQDAVAQQWRCVKEGRNQQLAASDWICSVSDFVHPKKDEFVVYRQALRDITAQSNPFQLVWPVSP